MNAQVLPKVVLVIEVLAAVRTGEPVVWGLQTRELRLCRAGYYLLAGYRYSAKLPQRMSNVIILVDLL